MARNKKDERSIIIVGKTRKISALLCAESVRQSAEDGATVAKSGNTKKPDQKKFPKNRTLLAHEVWLCPENTQPGGWLVDTCHSRFAASRELTG